MRTAPRVKVGTSLMASNTKIYNGIIEFNIRNLVICPKDRHAIQE